MATVIMHAVVSVDGFVADQDDDPGPLFDWYFNGDRPIVDEAGEQRHAPFRVSGRSDAYVSAFWGSIGATIQGRHLFDLTNGWEAEPPAGEAPAPAAKRADIFDESTVHMAAVRAVARYVGQLLAENKNTVEWCAQLM